MWIHSQATPTDFAIMCIKLIEGRVLPLVALTQDYGLHVFHPQIFILLLIIYAWKKINFRDDYIITVFHRYRKEMTSVTSILNNESNCELYR